MGNNRFNGKAIYNPSGKAGEYSDWACNFYTGCSNNCDYCYCKKGVMSHVWSDTPKLKKCFRDEEEAISIFEKELLANLYLKILLSTQNPYSLRIRTLFRNYTK